MGRIANSLRKPGCDFLLDVAACQLAIRTYRGKTHPPGVRRAEFTHQITLDRVLDFFS